MKKKILSFLAIISAFLFIGNVQAIEIDKDDIEKGSYVIGTHLFERKVTEHYDGTLTVKHIMLAAQSIGSDNIEDMVIYLKNSRDKWVDGLTNESITVPENFEIEYKNTQKYILNTPYLKYEVAPIINGNYYLHLEMDKETTGSIDGIEVHYAPVNSDTFDVIYNGNIKESSDSTGKKAYIVDIENEISKLHGNYKVKTYRHIDGEKAYSEFSNIITYKKPDTPILKLVSTKKDKDDLVGTLLVENYLADKNTEIRIFEYRSYEYLLRDEPNYTYRIDYNKQEIDVPVLAGNKYYYKAQVKKTYTGEHYYEAGTKGEYSDESEAVYIDNITVEIPELSSEYIASELINNLYVYYDLSISNEAVPNGYWELFEVSEYNSQNQYTKISSVAFGDTYRLRLVNNEQVSYAARICQETGYDKNCSDYSNIIEFDEESIKIDVLSEIELDIAYSHNDFYNDGIYTFSYEIKNYDAIPSYYAWTLYEVDGNSKTKISTAKIYEPIGFSLEAGTNKNLAVGICFTKEQDDICDTLYAEIGNVDTNAFLDIIPELSLVEIEEGELDLTFVNGNLELKFNLNNLEEYELFSKYDNPRYLVQGWQLFEQRDAETGTYVSVAEAEMTSSELSLQIPYGEEKTFVARVYIEDTQGNRYYSDSSEELIIDTTDIITFGDVTEDGEVDGTDATQVLRYIDGLREFSKEQLIEADVNLDGKIDNVDYRIILATGAGYVESLPLIDYVIYGDANLNGLVDEEDASFVQNHISGTSLLTAQALKNADINADGAIDNEDVILIQELSLGNIAHNNMFIPVTNTNL